MTVGDELNTLAERDPFPWLLDESNPSARFLTLRDLFDSNLTDPRLAATQSSIVTWDPVARILSEADPVDLWGRKERPFYGGAIGTQATLCLLADLGLPTLPIIRLACENLLTYGQDESGGFSFESSHEHVVLCHTGRSVQALACFGYARDERIVRALDYLVDRALAPDGGSCPYCETEECQWGLERSLAAFAALPKNDLSGRRQIAVDRLANALLGHEFEFGGRDGNWLRFGFPLHYSTDLSELCDVLARLGYGADQRFERLLDVVMAARTEDGKWIKGQGTRALLVEARGAPSKWITIRVLRALRHATITQANAARSRLHRPVSPEVTP